MPRTLLRDVTAEEYPWLPRTFKAGEVLYEKPDLYGVCSPNGELMSEEPGQNPGYEFPATALGPEAPLAVPDPHKCGIGRKADCCIFLTASAKGFECERYGPLHGTLLKRRPVMSAQRAPEEPWPECMIFPESEGQA